MNLLQITPGAGGMYCGNCFRDNALVAALRQQGHQATMIPLYLPMTLEEPDQSAGTPIFFSGVNVYLEQKSAFFRRAPNWLHRLLASPALLKWASGRAAKTRAEDVGDLTLSMLRGEEGHQARELEELIGWLKGQGKPDVISLSNAMLVGLVRRLKQELKVPVVCMLAGEDAFLDSLPDRWRGPVWDTLAERAAEVDLYLAPSQYFADVMATRMKVARGRVQVVYNGINLAGYEPAASPPSPPVLGYFARMCPDKGLDTLVDAFLWLKARNRIPNLRLLIGGGCGPGDEPFVNGLRERLQARGFLGDVDFHPNLERAAKQAFFRRLTVLSVPAMYGEAFGLYILESLAAGIPVVQPRHAAFPELVRETGGGILYEPGRVEALGEALEGLLADPARARQLGETGRQAVRARFSIEAMAQGMLQACTQARDGRFSTRQS
jgi:glycosyltransferase involved in cell wall biosynthesis